MAEAHPLEVERRLSTSVLRLVVAVVLIVVVLVAVVLAGAVDAREAGRFENNPASPPPGWPTEAVETVAIDGDGFLWFGSENGLYRYDGYGSRVYRPDLADPASLGGSQIEDIHEDRRGELWIATSRGLDRFVRAEGRFEHFRHRPSDPRSLSHDHVLSLLEDPAGRLWVGTAGGLDRLDREAGDFTRFLAGGESAFAVPALLEAPAGTLWLGTRRGLARFDPETGEARWYRHAAGDPRSLSDDRVLALCDDGDGGLWVGTERGLNRFDPASGRFRRYLHDADDPGSLAFDEVQALHLDASGELWIGTFGGGLDRLRPGEEVFRHFKNDPADPSSLSGNGVRTIFEDPTGVVWLGTYGGLNKYDRRQEQFERITRRTLGASSGQGVWAEASGVLWIGATDRLLRLDRERGTVETWHADLDRPGALPPGYVSALWKDGDVLWVGTQGGLCRFPIATGSFDCQRHDPDDSQSLPGDWVLTLHEDRRGRVWVGTGGGLCELDRGSRRCRRLSERPDAAPWPLAGGVHGVAEDRSGALWITVQGGGLYRLGECLEGFRHDPDDPASLSSDDAVAVHVDGDGNVWVGTWGGGLNRLDVETGAFTRWGEADGLPSATVTSLLEDDRGRLWIGTYGGLSRFDPRTGRFRNYDRTDGLAGEVFSVYASFKAPDGELIFGGAGGLTAFDPERLAADEPPPPVVLTAFHLHHQPAPLRAEDPSSPLERPILDTRHLVLDHRQDDFAFEFAALSFRDPRQNRYRYRLEGFDRSWIETGADQRYVRYTNLDAGRYTFRVWAANADGVWNEDGAAVEITVLPPPWQSGWAYALYVLTAGLAIGGVARARHRKLARERQLQRREAERDQQIIRRLREVDKLKDAFLANTSHELRTPLFGMVGLAEALLDGARGELPESARGDLAMLIASGRRLSSLVDDILDFSRLEEHDLELRRRPVDLASLSEVVLALTRPLASGKDLALVNAVDPDLPPAWADENRLQQILLNLVGNAVKFTAEGKVEVTAERAAGELTVRVRDTGIGIAKAKRQAIFRAFEQADASVERTYGGTGLGLAVSEKLVTLHGGRIWVDSTPGEGSTFAFTLPVADAAAAAAELPSALAAFSVPAGGSANGGAVAAQTGVEEGPEGAQRILVVDDEPVNRQVLLNHLSVHRYATSSAADGPEALEILDRTAIDLVLLDVMMPRLSGYEVCRRIREERGPHELPVIFLTAKSQPADLVHGFEVGANDYLAKPIAKDELLARVRTHLDLQATHRLLRAQHATVERQSAELLRQASALEARNAELTYITNIISHDLRNPLTTIQLLLGFLERDSEVDMPRMRRSIVQIRGAAETLERLMGDLVELSRVGRGTLAAEPVDLGALARSAAEVLGERLAARHVELVIGDSWPPVVGDRRRLFELFHLLLDNALKFLGDPASPRIELGARRVQGDTVEVFVGDNGLGVAPRYHDRVFGLFEQLDPRVEGTGVGLALARRIVDLHGGSIWIESAGEGLGTTVRFTLPAAKAPAGDADGAG